MVNRLVQRSFFAAVVAILYTSISCSSLFMPYDSEGDIAVGVQALKLSLKVGATRPGSGSNELSKYLEGDLGLIRVGCKTLELDCKLMADDIKEIARDFASGVANLPSIAKRAGIECLEKAKKCLENPEAYLINDGSVIDDDLTNVDLANVEDDGLD